MSVQYRQGDILLIQVPALPESPACIPTALGHHLLALGETTGHAHYVPALEAVMSEANEAMRSAAQAAGVAETQMVLGGLTVASGAMLYHGTPTTAPAGPRDGDHAFLALPAGHYLVIAPREYTGEDEFVRIAD